MIDIAQRERRLRAVLMNGACAPASAGRRARKAGLADQPKVIGALMSVVENQPAQVSNSL